MRTTGPATVSEPASTQSWHYDEQGWEVIAVGSISKRLLGAVAIAVLTICLSTTAGAEAAAPWWRLDSLSIPGNLAPGGQGKLLVSATNLGTREIDGSSTKVTLRDVLPAGLVATSVAGRTGGVGGFIGIRGSVECEVVTGALVECSFEGALPPYEAIEAEISVEVLGSARSGEPNEVVIAGGGAVGASLQRPVLISAAPTPFGPQNFEQLAFNEDGSLDTQAGSHPYGLTTTLDLNRVAQAPFQPAQPKDLRFDLPPGLIGNPQPFPQCTDAQFEESSKGLFTNACPAATTVGVAAVTIYEPEIFHQVLTLPVPLFNLKPEVGEPARFGFDVLGTYVTLDTAVRTGGDYGVTVSVNNITQIVALLASQVTFWGVPGDPTHDQSRGWECVAGGIWPLVVGGGFPPCTAANQGNPPPLLSMPTSCTGPLQVTMQADSWAQPGSFTPALPSPFEPALDGCNRLPFAPSITVAPDGTAASSPTGLSVGIHVPQDALLSSTGLAEANVKDTTVTLPAGVALNPSAADGLQACSESQIALSADVAAMCPEASKVGTVEIKTPLLPHALKGAVYLATQGANPFGSLVALYIAAEDPVSGTLVKVAGEVAPDPVTGQLVSTFKDTPQLPFEDLTLHFFGGSRAPLGTPGECGSYTTHAAIAPWSGNASAEPISTFQILSGPNESPCVSPLPFAPTLTAGSTNIQAGAFTPFTTTMSREDGQQGLDAIQLHMPAGLSGSLSGVKLCGEAQADAGTCGPESLIGHTIVSVGLGGDPYTVTGGEVFITGPYEGAPFGLSIVNPAKAGPFDLGKVVVRARIEVDPTTAALTITTDSSGPYAIPQILDGIPLEIKHVNVTIDRSQFTFNPTNCSRMAITGGLTSAQGATSALSVPFQVTNCATLKFKPSFSASTSGKPSRANGASLDVKLAYPQGEGQANIAKVKVELPKALPSRLSTLQKACTEVAFDANPESCPAASRVGQAVATTPILAGPLAGPAYFVSHGGAKFPELVVVLKGEDGVTVDLHGETFISKQGITSSTFSTVPDVPVGSFELKLPQGPYSALAANANLCKGKLTMPTEFLAQNGASIHQQTKIAVTGCPKAKKAAHGHRKARGSQGRRGGVGRRRSGRGGSPKRKG
jgi:hypothetical protein